MKSKKKQGILAAHGMSALDIVKDIIFFFITVVVTFGYIMLIQLIISFIMLSIWHFTIERMLIFAAICAFIMGIVYIVRTAMRYKRIFG